MYTLIVNTIGYTYVAALILMVVLYRIVNKLKCPYFHNERFHCTILLKIWHYLILTNLSLIYSEMALMIDGGGS